MGREIKFRAWDGTEMYTPIIGDKGELFRSYRDVEDFNPAPHDDLMQYTSLKDQNNQDIYEGDILTHKKYGTLEVKFTNGKFTCDSIDLSDIHEWSEIIGNIYENPELIEV